MFPLQVTVLVNQAPEGGMLAIDGPFDAVALTTTHTLYTDGWRDPEGDLPLSYGFYADVGGLDRPRLPLSDISTSDEVMVRPPTARHIWVPFQFIPLHRTLHVADQLLARGSLCCLMSLVVLRQCCRAARG